LTRRGWGGAGFDTLDEGAGVLPERGEVFGVVVASFVLPAAVDDADLFVGERPEDDFGLGGSLLLIYSVPRHGG
jgi:hypothetical protein